MAFYWVVSLSVVFLNKYIFRYALFSPAAPLLTRTLSSSENKFPYPLFVTWYQIFVALVLLVVCGWLGQFWRPLSMIPPMTLTRHTSSQIMPLTLLYVGMLGTNNLCLQYVEVSFYQVARSLSIVFNIIFTYTVLGQKTSSPAIMSCVIIFIGFVLGSYGEMNFSWEGVVYGVAASCFVALYGIFVKKKLAVVQDNEWVLLQYNTALATVVLLPIVYASGEFAFLSDPEVAHLLTNWSFWLVMTITAITGFLINIAIFLQIKVTTSLTNTISGTAKACVQSLLGWLVFRNVITPLNLTGILLSLAGSALYSWVRFREMRR